MGPGEEYSKPLPEELKVNLGIVDTDETNDSQTGAHASTSHRFLGRHNDP